MKLLGYRVTLDIMLDPSEGRSEPTDWDWADLLNLGERDRTHLVECQALSLIGQDFVDTGWALFDYDDTGLKQIQRIDDTDLFDTDAEAIDYVMEMAANGSQKHLDALAEHRRDEVAILRLRLGLPR